MRATTLPVEPSTLARPIVAVSDSRLNQATRWPASIAAPGLARLHRIADT